MPPLISASSDGDVISMSWVHSTMLPVVVVCESGEESGDGGLSGSSGVPGDAPA